MQQQGRGELCEMPSSNSKLLYYWGSLPDFWVSFPWADTMRSCSALQESLCCWLFTQLTGWVFRCFGRNVVKVIAIGPLCWRSTSLPRKSWRKEGVVLRERTEILATIKEKKKKRNGIKRTRFISLHTFVSGKCIQHWSALDLVPLNAHHRYSVL